MSAETARDIVLDRLVPELRSEGYDVFVRPRQQMLPSFLGPYAPDVIALRADKNIAIAFALGGGRSDDTLRELVKRFEGQRGWELRVVWVNPGETGQSLQPQTSEAISGRLQEISGLLGAGFVDSAMLMCWAALEAIGRNLMRDEFSRPQTTGRLIQVLAKEGHITPDEADRLRQVADTRNRFIHGELTTAANRSDVEAFMRILSSLADNAQAAVD
jgi:uncharacterized protein YutE (UPF0331/DUF86 family)